MAGVQDIVRCPQCGEESLMTEFQTRNCEETGFCSNCGYLEGRVIRRRKSDGGYLLRKDGTPIFREYAIRGHGAWEIQFADAQHGVIAIGRFDRPRTRAQAEKFLKRAEAAGHTVLALSVMENGKLSVLRQQVRQ